MMIALLAIMVVLAINSIMMDGAAEGLKFYLIPDFERMKELGIGYTIVTAMNQAFFTLSLGIGAMAIFGSYIGNGKIIAWRICKYCDSGYICGNRIRSDHFPGMLYLRSKSNIRTEA